MAALSDPALSAPCVTSPHREAARSVHRYESPRITPLAVPGSQSKKTRKTPGNPGVLAFYTTPVALKTCPRV
jgi:hypothetical protein